MVEHQLIEYSAAQHVDTLAGNGAVGVEPDLSALTDISTCNEPKQVVCLVFLVLTQERRVRIEQVVQQHEEGLADTGSRIGMGNALIADTLEPLSHMCGILCHAALFYCKDII